jgi:hypothetical protein
MFHHDAVEATAGEALQCPRCGLPATITDRFTLNGSPGQVAHAKVMCVGGHWFTPPIESLRRRLHDLSHLARTRLPPSPKAPGACSEETLVAAATPRPHLALN